MNKMKKKRILMLVMVAVMIAFSGIAMTACGDKDSGDKNKDLKTTDNADLTDEELKEKATELNKDEDNFYGTWKATSDNAEMLYGHLEITINEDGTFDADVTDEVFSGRWEKIDGGIEYKSELMNGKLFYGKKCHMVIEDSDLYVTLTKVE